MEVSLTEKKVTDGLSREKLDVIFHRPGCRELFEDKIAAVRVEDNDSNKSVIAAFSKIFMHVPSAHLQFSDDEFTSLCDAVIGESTDVHVGILIKITQLLDNAKPCDYADNPEQYRTAKAAVSSLRKEIDSLTTPIRDTCVEEFYANAGADEMDDIKFALKEYEQRNKNAMPGTAGLKQFNFGN